MVMNAILYKFHSSRKRCQGLSAAVAGLAALLSAVTVPASGQGRGQPWTRHVIDSSSNGADGARTADVNGDGLMDIVSGWEEGGIARAYLHPGPGHVALPWPAVTVGSVTDVEDAVFVDLDRDGAMDVVTCSEGNTRQIRVHWAPSSPADYLDPAKWQSAVMPASVGLAWMYAEPMQVDGLNGIDLVAGCKFGGVIAWFESPAANPRNLALWTRHTMSAVGWTMSLIARDLDGDGDLDMAVTDRFNDVGLQGARWLENPGTGTAAQKQPWPNRFIGAQGQEAMLSAFHDMDGDGLEDLLVPIRTPASLILFRRLHPMLNNWQGYTIAGPANVGVAKAVSVGDIDIDGDPDLVVSFAEASGGKSGVVWMSYLTAPTDPVWQDHEISGPAGIKFDLVALVDLDLDADLDVITTEEQEGGSGLGLIWYENPTRAPVPGDYDRDRDVDLDDFAHLQVCFSGPGIPPSTAACADGDLDGDNDVDSSDLSLWWGCITGADVPADPACIP